MLKKGRCCQQKKGDSGHQDSFGQRVWTALGNLSVRHLNPHSYSSETTADELPFQRFEMKPD